MSAKYMQLGIGPDGVPLFQKLGALYSPCQFIAEPFLFKPPSG